MEEIWKQVPGYPGYEASNLGQVRIVKVLSDRPCRGNYNVYCLYKKEPGQRRGERKDVTAHSVIMETFVGPRPKGMQILHKDGNPRNNRVDNLRYGTAKENAQDKYRHGTIPWGEKSHRCKLTAIEVEEIKSTPTLNGETENKVVKRTARKFNTSESTIYHIRRGHRRTHG